MKWTEEQLKLYVAQRLEKCYFYTASAIASQAFYAGYTEGYRFDRLRSQIFDMIRIYKQKHPL